MASDLDTIKAMFDRADVAYQVNPTGEQEFQNTHPQTTQVLDTVSSGKGNLGYPGFFTGFGFDQDGQLLWVGAWE